MDRDRRAYPDPYVRTADEKDLGELVDLERICFTTDRMSRRSFARFLKRPDTARFLVLADEGNVAGYALALLHKQRSSARLYSIAIAPRLSGRGFGRILLREMERVVGREGWHRLRLEVRADNLAAIALYQSEGFQEVDRLPRYYADHMLAIRFEKLLPCAPGT